MVAGKGSLRVKLVALIPDTRGTLIYVKLSPDISADFRSYVNIEIDFICRERCKGAVKMKHNIHEAERKADN